MYVTENKLNNLPVDEKELDSLLQVKIEREVIEEEEEEEDKCYLDDYIVVKEWQCLNYQFTLYFFEWYNNFSLPMLNVLCLLFYSHSP